MKVKFNLLAPPSANRIWRVAGGRVYKSKEYKEWIATECWKVMKAAQALDIRQPLVHPLWLSVGVHASDGRNGRRDLDNYLKPIGDLLQRAELIHDDREIERITVWRGEPMLTHHVDVELMGMRQE